MSITKAVSDVANNVLDKFVQDKDLKEQLAHNLKMELIELDKAQIGLNAEEAKKRELVCIVMETLRWICLWL